MNHFHFVPRYSETKAFSMDKWRSQCSGHKRNLEMRLMFQSSKTTIKLMKNSQFPVPGAGELLELSNCASLRDKHKFDDQSAERGSKEKVWAALCSERLLRVEQLAETLMLKLQNSRHSTGVTFTSSSLERVCKFLALIIGALKKGTVMLQKTTTSLLLQSILLLVQKKFQISLSSISDICREVKLTMPKNPKLITQSLLFNKLKVIQT